MEERKYLRTILAYKDYFKNFKRTVPQNVLRKFYEVFIYIMTMEVIPSIYFRSIEGVSREAAASNFRPKAILNTRSEIN